MANDDTTTNSVAGLDTPQALGVILLSAIAVLALLRFATTGQVT